ncbi:MAG: BTAD domain-containing putative transcriptional regulator [Solirubrobacteraceae bacterium]
MEFRVLGPLEVVEGGKALRLAGPQQRAVLALLILNAPEPVSSDRMADALWGERAPSTAHHAVQVHVSAIRRLLRGPSESVLLSDRSFGYRLDVDPDDVDRHVFERLVDEGRTALGDGRNEDAAATLGRALELWRGPALADFAFMDFASTEAARLEELRVVAIEARLEARLRAGDPTGVVGELQALVAEHPLREHARWLLMRALYSADRQADALAVYRAGRRILSDELGLEPGRDLRDLEQAILQHATIPDPAADLSPAVAQPDFGGKPSQALVSLPLPAPVRAVAPLAYVGRAGEHATVRRCWQTACTGARQALMIAGEPGIGKTRLAFQAVSEFHDEGALVMIGRCPEELTVPYGPWIQALSPFVEHADEKLLAGYLERYGGDLARILPAVSRRVPQAPAPSQTDPESERYLLFSAVVGLLEQASALAPLVVLIDDLHWADTTTLGLFKHVLAETSPLRLLVLATYRDSDLFDEHPLSTLLADLRREHGVERLAIPGLGPEDIQSLLQATGVPPAHAHDGELARDLVLETGGNAFFVGEMLRHLADAGTTGDRADASSSKDSASPRLRALGLPQSVREVVRRRVSRLGPQCRDALTYASIIGSRFDLDVLERVAEIDADELIDLLDGAEQAALVQERGDRVGSFMFAHDLIHHSLYEDVGHTRRTRLHRRIAEALEELRGENAEERVEELARHWLAASPPDPERSVAYAMRAGEHALAQLAPGEALRWFEQAMGALDDSPSGAKDQRCELMICLGEAQRQAGHAAFRETFLAAARLAEEIGDGARMARAATANSRGFASAFGAVDAERLAVLDRAAVMNRGGDPATRARLLSLQAMELQFDPDYERRWALADEALGLAREAGDERVLPYVLRDHFHATWSVDTLDERRRTAEEMRELAARADDPLVPIWALDRSVHVAVESGHLTEASATLSRLRERTDALGQPALRWHATYFAAGLAQLRGDLAESERLAEAAARLGEQAAEPDTAFIAFGQICMLRVEQARSAEVVDVMEQAAANYPAVPAYEAAYATVLCGLGRVREAAPMLERRTERGFAELPRDQVYLTALALWGIVAADVASEQAAAALYELILPWRDQLVWDGANGYGSAEHHLGRLAATFGATDRAREHFVAASRLHEEQGVKVWEARNLCAWAHCLLATGETAEGVGLAERALHLARANGYELSTALARGLLDAEAVA